MFNFKINIDGTERDFHPNNSSSIMFIDTARDLPCIGFSRAASDDYIVDSKQLQRDGVYQFFIDLVKGSIDRKSFVSAYDEEGNLYHKGFFTAKTIYFDEDKEIYSISVVTQDVYTEFEKSGDFEFNIYDYVSDFSDIEDNSGSSIFQQNIPDCVKLTDILQAYINRLFGASYTGTQYTLSSTFLLNEYNPVSGIQNDTNTLYLCQSSNVIKASETADIFSSATKFELSFNTIMNDLTILYKDLRWSIDEDNGLFKIETIQNIRANPIGTYNDLTAINSGKYTAQTNKYRYDNESVPSNIILKNPVNKYFYFDKQSFDYQNTESSSIEETTTGYTDVVGLGIEPDDYSNELFFWLCTTNNTDDPLEVQFLNVDYGARYEVLSYNGSSVNTMDTLSSDTPNAGLLLADPAQAENSTREIIISNSFEVSAGSSVKVDGFVLIEYPNFDVTYNEGLPSEYTLFWENAQVIGNGLISNGLSIYVVSSELDDLGEQEVISNTITIGMADFDGIQDEQPYYSLLLNLEDRILNITDPSPDARLVFSFYAKVPYQVKGTSSNSPIQNASAISILCDTKAYLDTDFSILNEKLAFAYTMPKYFLNDQYAKSGIFSYNSNLIEFSSVKKLKSTDVLFQVENQSEFDGDGYVKTPVGDLGVVSNIKYDHLKKQYSGTILHDNERRLSDENKIIDIQFDGLQSWYVDNLTVYIEVSKTTDLTNITPIVKISPYATISPESGTTNDYSSPLVHTVTSESGRNKLYQFIVFNKIERWVVKNDREFSSNLQLFTSSAISTISVDVKSDSAIPDSYIATGTYFQYYPFIEAKTKSNTMVRFSDVTKIYDFGIQYLFSGVVDLRDYVSVTAIYIRGQRFDVGTCKTDTVLMPSHNLSMLLVSVEYTGVKFIDFSGLTGVSSNADFRFKHNGMNALQTDEQLREIAKKEWTGLSVDVRSNSIPEYRIVFLDIAVAGTGYIVGDILQFTGGDGSDASVRVDSVGVSGEITKVSIYSVGSGYTAIMPTGTTGGSGATAVISGYTAKYYLENALGATVQTD